MKQKLIFCDFMDAFKNMNRDYYSYDAYKELYEWHDSIEDYTLDVIAICCSWSEYSDLEELIKDYDHLVDDYQLFLDDKFTEQEQKELTKEEKEIYQDEYEEYVVEEISNRMTLIKLVNGGFLIN